MLFRSRWLCKRGLWALIGRSRSKATLDVHKSHASRASAIARGLDELGFPGFKPRALADRLRFVWMAGQGFLWLPLTEGTRLDLQGYVRKVKARLLGIDPIAGADLNEKRPDQVAQFIGYWRAFAKEGGCAVLIAVPNTETYIGDIWNSGWASLIDYCFPSSLSGPKSDLPCVWTLGLAKTETGKAAAYSEPLRLDCIKSRHGNRPPPLWLETYSETHTSKKSSRLWPDVLAAANAREIRPRPRQRIYGIDGNPFRWTEV